MTARIYIENRYIEDFEELRRLVEAEVKPDSSVSKQLIAAGCDGVLGRWLAKDSEAQRLGIVFDADQFVALNSDIKRFDWLKKLFSVESDIQKARYTGLLEVIKSPKETTLSRLYSADSNEVLTLSFSFKSKTEMDERVSLRLCDDVQTLDLNNTNIQELRFHVNISNVKLGSILKLQIDETKEILWQYLVQQDLLSCCGNIAFLMKFVEGGRFLMGIPDNDSEGFDDEKPRHWVELSDYYIGETVVTQALWNAVMGNNPSEPKGDGLPVVNVSWYDSQEFIRRLNQKTGRNFRLPTEAEWEYAAKGGRKSNGFKYSGGDTYDLSNLAWYFNNSEDKLHEAKSKSPNELGLYNMSGNVWEWCYDWEGGYSNVSQTNPNGPSSGTSRVLRGGSWNDKARNCRVSYRMYKLPTNRLSSIGLRLALSR